MDKIEVDNVKKAIKVLEEFVCILENCPSEEEVQNSYMMMSSVLDHLFMTDHFLRKEIRSSNIYGVNMDES